MSSKTFHLKLKHLKAAHGKDGEIIKRILSDIAIFQGKGRACPTHPLRTPSTRFSIKKDPEMTMVGFI